MDPRFRCAQAWESLRITAHKTWYEVQEARMQRPLHSCVLGERALRMQVESDEAICTISAALSNPWLVGAVHTELI